MCLATLRQALTGSAFVALAILAAIPSTVRAQPDFPPLPPSQALGPTDAEIFPVPGEPPHPLAFGSSIATDGRDLMIGMPLYGDSTGRIAVFRRNPSNVWERVGQLEGSEARELEGDCALVSAYNTLYQFRRKHGTWVQTQTADEGLLTCHDDDVFVAEQDGVHVLHPDKRGRLDPAHPRQTLTSGEGNADIEFGIVISANRRTLAIGAPLDDDGRGAVFIFVRHGTRWVRSQKLIAIDGQPGDHFGRSISVSDHLIAIGAPDRAVPPDPACFPDPHGAAYVFARFGRFWFEREKIETPQCAYGFGVSVVVNRRLLAIGDSSVRFSHPASAYVYEPTGWRFTLLGVSVGPIAGSPVLALTPSTLFIGFPSEDSPWPIGGVAAFRFAHPRWDARSIDGDRADELE